MAHISIYCGFCFWSQDLPSDARGFSLTSFEVQLSFSLWLNKGLIFSKVHSGSELLNNFLWSVNVLFFSNYCIMLGPAC